MAMPTQALVLVLVRRYHQAWTGGDFAGAGRCLAPDLETAESAHHQEPEPATGTERPS